MLFSVLLISLILIALCGGFLVYHTSDYNHADRTASFEVLTIVGGGLIAFGILMGAGSAATGDTDNHVVTKEKTYTLADNSVPVYDGTKLTFVYVEDGKTLAYNDWISGFDVPMEKPKALKITHYDVVDHSILPWVIGDHVNVEIIK